MTESLQTRTEHSRSLEDAEQLRAIHTLTELGMLVPVSEVETYHGRVGQDAVKEWAVDPAFANGGNDSGNLNVNNRPTLYTSEASIAKDFAKKRGAIDRLEIHDITSDDADARLIDLSFKPSSLSEEDGQKYQQALRALVIPITEGSPVDFNARGMVVPFAKTIGRLNKGFISNAEVAGIAKQAGIDEGVALQLASGYNSMKFAGFNPLFLVSSLLANSGDFSQVKVADPNGNQAEGPINLEYVQRYLRNAHIVGAKQVVDSATLNRLITAIPFFDLEKTTTTKGLETKRRQVWQKLGGFASSLSQVSEKEFAQRKQPLLRLLNDVYAKPEKLVAAAKQVEGYDEIFEADAGNWEGFTLAEHTETVLRNFDENYADELPVEFLAPMRLAILAHDVGKPIAAAHGEKYRQKEYNAAQAEDFLTKLDISASTKKLLLAVIGEGAELAFQIDVRHVGEDAEAAMRNLAVKTLQNIYSKEGVTESQIEGFTEMCKILQICDGGAYTSMAVTRGRGRGVGRYRNAPSFNGSFAQPVGFGKRSIKPKEVGKPSAAPNLTPRNE